ncbi:hypothetical protein ACJ41O_011340 [Fusarium nematophilum]
MSSGYNDPSKLADALELARMFKSGGSDHKGKKGGGNKGNDDLAFSRRQEPFHYNPPPPPPINVSNIPPPSQRNYTDTLASDPLKRAPGRILGRSPMDFLNRREPSSKPATSSLSRETPNQAASQLVTPVIAAGGDKSFGSAHNDAPNTSEKKSSLAVSSDGTKPSKVVGIDQVKPTTEAPTSSTQVQTSTSSELICLEPPPKNSISNTFFSLMSEDSDGDSDNEPQTPQARPVSTLHQSVLNGQGGTKISGQAEEDLIDISSDPKPNALSQKHVPNSPFMPVSLGDQAMGRAESHNFGPPPKEQHQSSVQNIMTENRAQTQSSASKIHSGGKLETEEPKPDPRLRPQAPGQLFMQPQVDTFNQPHAPVTQTPTTGNEMRAQNGENPAAASTQRPKKASETPAKGLRSSMWAA